MEAQPLKIKDSPGETRVLNVMAGHLRTSLAANFGDLWQAVRACDLVLAEVAEQFDGTDPVRPAKREVLEQVRARLRGLGEQLIWLEVEVELREPDAELLTLIRRMVRLD